jgi:RHS repeat-associated protein
VVEYTLGGGRLISQERGGDTRYYLADGQNSTRNLTNELGAITDSYRYAAFGELVSSAGSTPNKYLYTGQQFDAATGQYSLRARYYQPGVGRFTARDQWAYDFQNPVEFNRYGYTANNSVNAWDPTGMFFEWATIKRYIGTATNAIRQYFGDKFISGAATGALGYILGLLLYGMVASVLTGGNFIDIVSKKFNPIQLTLEAIGGAMTNTFADTYYTKDIRRKTYLENLDHGNMMSKAYIGIALSSRRVHLAGEVAIFSGFWRSFAGMMNVGWGSEGQLELEELGISAIQAMAFGIVGGLMTGSFTTLFDWVEQHLKSTKIQFGRYTLDAAILTSVTFDVSFSALSYVSWT